MYWKALLLWLGFGVTAFACGALRELVLRPRIGEQPAHQIGTVVVSLVVFGLIVLFVRWVDPDSREAIRLGILWVVLSVLFELGFFHYVMGTPWEELLADCNILRGRLLLLFWLTQLVSPYLVVRYMR